MAGTETYTVVLDANVLYPISVIDLILSLAGTNLFYARWSDDIETEAVTAVEPLTARSIELGQQDPADYQGSGHSRTAATWQPPLTVPADLPPVDHQPRASAVSHIAAVSL
jgi:hypothetical protein